MRSAQWMDLVMQERRYSNLDKAREDLTLANMLTGEEFFLFDQKVRIRLEWTDGAPMTGEQLRACGEQMKAAALSRLAGHA